MKIFKFNFLIVLILIQLLGCLNHKHPFVQLTELISNIKKVSTIPYNVNFNTYDNVSGNNFIAIASIPLEKS